MKGISEKIKSIYILSFLLPVSIMLGIFVIRGIFPFGNNSFMFSDMYHQYVPFLTEFWHKLHNGESLIYSWHTGLGSNFIAVYAYYLASPINWLVYFVPENLIIEFMTYQIVLKIGLCGFSFCYYLHKRFDTKDITILWFSVFYALSGFIAAYNWNHMWLDGVWLAPFILLGLEELVKKGKCRMYCLTLAASILSNFYLSILICIFLVFYFFVQLFTNGLTFRKKCRAVWNFGISSLLAGGMAGVLLIPVLNAMSNSEFTKAAFPKKIEFYFNVLEMLARHVPMLPTERGLDHWPNIYCGVLAFILVPVYFCHKRIPLRQKIGKLILLAVFLLAFSINILNFIWHGMNYPNSLPARQSFLYIFVILTMCFEAVYRNRENNRVNRMVGSALGMLLLGSCGLFVYSDNLTVWVMAGAWIFLAGYFLLMLFFGVVIKKSRKNAGASHRLTTFGRLAVLALVCTEAAMNMGKTSVQTVQRDYYLNKKADYKELLAEAKNREEGFFRLDSFSQMTKNDGALAGYPSASIFSSIVNANVKKYYDNLGMGGSKVSYYYQGTTPLTSGLMGIRYSFSEKELDPVLYEKIATGNSLSLYENRYALPVGIFLDKEFCESIEDELVECMGNAIFEQNKLAKVVCGKQFMYTPMSYEELDINENVITVTVAAGGHIYGVVTGKPTGKISLSTGDESIELEEVSNEFLLDLGRFHKGEQFVLSSSEKELLRIQFYRLSDAVLKEVVGKLSEVTFKPQQYTAASLGGTITVSNEGYLVLSVPHEKGWNVKVDGILTEYEQFANTMIAIPLNTGSHSVDLYYTLQGWKTGLAVSLLSVFIFAVLYGRQRKNQRKRGKIMNLEQQLQELTQKNYKKEISQCSNKELYYSLLNLTKEYIDGKAPITGDKKVYYISAEFLIGKLLSNNLINLGLYDEVKELLCEKGKSLANVEEEEPEPSLGNGGLGRLAACFLDSISTLGLPGDGIGLNYHFGLFKQIFTDKLQDEQKNDWIEKQSWLQKTDTVFTVKFGDYKVNSRLYDIAVVGFHNGVNKLHLFDLETVEESIVKEGISFDKEDIKKNLTLFLYPDDSDEAGNLLRIYQQYFMVSSGAQLILKEMREKGVDLHRLYEHAVIQINDTHPTMVIPELIRLLTKEEGFSMDEAIEVVSKTCAYTNHTILAEALEKWPLKYLEKVVPKLVPIIKELDKRVAKKFKDPKVQIIDKDKRVHMAHIDIHYGFSVNGVAAIHTEILEQTELNHFYKLYPEKFNNKTNGITFRRWLLSCNHELADLITATIGEGYKTNADELEKLLQFENDEVFLDKLESIKKLKKEALSSYIYEKEKIDVNPDSIFDIQIKRLHEYKRQQMNVLYIIHKYLEIKRGKKPERPLTFIFGAKAAPAYIIAQDIIHLILVMQEIVSKDPETSPYMKVVMVENYNVSYAEKLIPACDISEQISLASKEASGTGNMKFMLNGAVTLGTADGANVEISELVGEDNIYIFGEKSEQVIAHYEKEDYISKKYYEKSPVIKEAVDFIVSKEALQAGHKENLERLYKELLNKDWFMTLLDLEDYIETKDRMFADYEDRAKWKRMMLRNIAKAGFFSSDRTIAEYNRDIWHLS